ncbi:tyrosine-type recombinase/integrase [Actinocrinis puniceicyclus]|uniref:Tyrosine-type recombinase/integrase n=1 Tax=Actinocrinis puniceicyclus TaxID=977794 RepID=A0A8J7WQ96_9ACTN|nr:tyrosine-type recombinase/integrase [Actinocrinis puniceicyclus]MBS2966676.1 tyrosine-type recombinase/integrase [Actinocrinis puniceicyclus]
MGPDDRRTGAARGGPHGARTSAPAGPPVAARERAPAAGAAGEWSDPARTLGACVEEFLRARQARKHAVNTLAAYRRDLEAIGQLLGAQHGVEGPDLPVEVVTGRALRQAFASFAQPRSAASVGRAWSVWNQFFSFLVADAVVPGNPMGTVDRPRPPHRFPKPLRGTDTPERLLASSAAPPDRVRRRRPWPERDFAVVALLLCAGLRSSELLELTVACLDGREGERYLKVRGKGGKERSIPVEPELDEVLAQYLESRRSRSAGRAPARSDPLFVGQDGAAMGRGALQYLVGRAYQEAGVSSRVPQGALVHALRHTFATRLAEDGASAVEIMRLLGHASLTTSQNYIDATAREQRAAVRANRTHQALRSLLSEHEGDGEAPHAAGRPAAGGA